MVDVLALARRYVPGARAGFSVPMRAVYMDMAVVCRVLAANGPQGWQVELLSPPCVILVDSEADALKLAQVMVNQIELSKGAFLEEMEGVQTRVLQAAHD